MKKTHLLYLIIIIAAIASCNTSASTNQRKVLGVFGGMGPMATAEFYKTLVTLTPATKDQEHIPTLIYSLPQTPDRTLSIKTGDTTIYKYLREGISMLEKNGAYCIVMPCNTVHHYYDYMCHQTKVPIINMIQEAVKEVSEKHKNLKKIGLLGTTATIKTRLYQDELEKAGFIVIVPNDSIQENCVMKAIYGIKAGTNHQLSEDLLAIAGNYVVAQGAELIVLGCTEIPLAFNKNRVTVEVIDPTIVLARRAIELYQKINSANKI